MLPLYRRERFAVFRLGDAFLADFADRAVLAFVGLTSCLGFEFAFTMPGRG